MKGVQSLESIAKRKLFFSQFTHRVAAASDEYPTTRCWSGRLLKRALNQVRADMLKKKELTTSFPRATELITWLLDIGLAYRLPLKLGPAVPPASQFYVLELGAGPESTVSPAELLQAYDPNGVICFFSALAFHGLTTQTPPFHHIAKSVSNSTQAHLEFDLPTIPDAPADRQPRSRLGSLLFTHQDVSFYATRRQVHLMAGIQKRILNPQTVIRITSPEQCLLDTLGNPEACGGQAVVFEAWERGWPKATQALVASALYSAGLPLTRRFAALAKLLFLPLSPELTHHLQVLRQERPFRDSPPLQLLRGVTGVGIDPDWNVVLPV